MANYEVRLVFEEPDLESGEEGYTLPYLQDISDPKEGMKATVIDGTRGDGSIVIPGGKKSQEITVKGYLISEGYANLTTAMNALRSGVTTNLATLTLEHREIGGEWSTDWTYYVRRINEIRFPQSFRLDIQEYEITFLVVSYS